MEECVIVIPIFSQYRDICRIFFALFKSNWADCPYRVLLAMIGEDLDIGGFEKIYISEHGKLSDCIVVIKKRYPAQYYLRLLGDAMMCSKVNTEEVGRLFKKLYEDGIVYCKVKPTKKKGTDLYRRIYSRESYIL